MSTKRQVIDSIRQKLKERNVDTNYTNQFLYNVLMEQAKWLIKRAIDKGDLWLNQSRFQSLSCVEVIETSTVEDCCPIKTNCKIYRTKEKIPETWTDYRGPLIRRVLSVDNTTDFSIINPIQWQAKVSDPYNKMSTQKYSFYANGYVWFPLNNPHYVNIEAFFKEDVSNLSGCSKTKDCVRYLDTEFMIPDSLEAEMFAKALQQLVPLKNILNDEQIDKNTNRKN